MTRAGVAVATPMTASPVGIDRLLERNVGRVVARDHRAGAIGVDRGGDEVGDLLLIPAVIDGFALVALEAPGGIRERAATFERLVPFARWGHARYCTSIQPSGKAP